MGLAIPAVTSAVIAALVAWLGLGNRSQYLLPDMHISAGLVVWAVMFGPLFGYAGLWYARIAVAARKLAPKDVRIVPTALVVFAAIGVAAVWFPQLPGNGRGPMQLALDSEVPVTLAAPLLILKISATTAALYAGAEGGLLTPGLTVGALTATLLGAGWNQLVGLQIDAGAYAIVGATALLASSMSMPFTAVVLILEFTRVSHDFLIPLLLAVAGAMATRSIAEHRG
jgi:H+/Cl- antiporter ClcA